MKRAFFALLIMVFLTGCSGSSKQEVEKFIQESFKARAEAVFTYKDKAPLRNYFSEQALEQSRTYLNWSPHGQWNNVRDLKYTTSIRFDKLRIDGKQATAVVYETAVITWEYIEPPEVTENSLAPEDAWGNKKHLLTLKLTPEGKWQIDQDIIE